jgi:hypothetical protein
MDRGGCGTTENPAVPSSSIVPLVAFTDELGFSMDGFDRGKKMGWAGGREGKKGG